MPISNLRAFVSELAQELNPAVELGASLPPLDTPEGRLEVAAWQEAFGYGPLLPLCRKKLRETPNDIDVLVLQTECLVHQGLFEEARRSASRALQVDPSHSAARAMHALVTVEDFASNSTDAPMAGRPDGGIAAEATAPTDPLLMAARAKDLFVRGDRTALSLANRAVALDPNNVWARMVQTDLTAHLVGAQESAAGAQALLALAPKSAAALHNVIRSGAPGVREPISDKAQQAALEDYRRLVTLSPGSAWACMASAHLGVTGGLPPPDVSGNGLVWPIEDGPMLSMALSQARSQADGGQKQAALATLDRAAKTFDKAFPIWAMRAELFAALGNAQKHEESLQVARNLAQGAQHIDITLRLAGVYIGRNDAAQAECMLQQALQVAPAHSEALLMLAQLRLSSAAKDPSLTTQRLADVHALAQRALLGDALYHAQAHYLIGLTAQDMTEVQRHMKAAIEAFAEASDGPRKLDAQKGLYCRFVENGDFADAQGVLNGLPDVLWGKFAAAADDPGRGVEIFRARSLGDATVVKSRAALASKNFQQAIVDIEEALTGLDVRDDAELYATLLGIKSVAYFELELHSEARELSRRAIEIARGSSISKTVSEAEIVRKRLAEHARSERKKWVMDFITRYLWLIIGASGAGSVYTLGMSFVKILRNAFAGGNTTRLTSHMRNQKRE